MDLLSGEIPHKHAHTKLENQLKHTLRKNVSNEMVVSHVPRVELKTLQIKLGKESSHLTVGHLCTVVARYSHVTMM